MLGCGGHVSNNFWPYSLSDNKRLQCKRINPAAGYSNTEIKFLLLDNYCGIRGINN